MQSLGLDRSLFERYHREAHMLDTQYRMVSQPGRPASGHAPRPAPAPASPGSPSSPQHKDICVFPSMEFYEQKLKTWQGLRRPPSVLGHIDRESCPVIFGHVQGHEQSLLVSTDEGNENSKANLDEVAEVVRVQRGPWVLEGFLEEVVEQLRERVAPAR